ncbi:MAG: hypothetical protein M4579_006593 [Chaenotheca gracillima]|nr:MAG: hypothetical protein M4579_006593 [Chaenotheca gracillima]
MASDSLLGGSRGANSGEAGPPEAGTVGALINEILEDCLENLLHDEVLNVHRDEKVARGRSAAFLAEQQAAQEGASANGVSSAANTTTSPSVGPSSGVITTSGGIYEDGKFTLVGNPLSTTKEVICPRCRLPQLFHPTTGKGAIAPDPDKQYCARHPPIEEHGRDIWGNLFHIDSATVTKAKKEMKKIAKAQADGVLDSSQATSSFDDKTSAPIFPSPKCPKCDRYLKVQRYAQHLERCMGLGRQPGRDAKARAGASGNGSTPYGSRMGTPNPSGKRSPKRSRDEDESDEEEEETPKKKKKKLIRKSLEKGPALKIKKALEDAGKVIPGLKDKAEKNHKKREREEDPDGETPAPTLKKVKSMNLNGSVPPRSSLLKQTSSTNGLSGPKSSPEIPKKKETALAKDSASGAKRKESTGPKDGSYDSPSGDERGHKSKKHDFGTPAQAVEV